MKTLYPILAIDYGDKHFGLAISDSKGIIGQPLDVISITKNRDIDSIIKEILGIAEENKVQTLLIGKPQAFATSQEKTLSKIDKFVNKIKEATNTRVLIYDESFSTIQAQNMLTFSGQSTKKSRSKIDKIAATVFLQEFLNSKKHNNFTE